MSDVIIDARDSLAAECAKRFERCAAAAIAARDRFTCALPGGSVAEACLPVVAHANVDWLQSSVFWCDERAVPPSDSQSNYGLAWRLWLRDGAVPADRIHRMPADAADLDGAAAAYEDELRRTLADPPRLDWVLLGAGADGHICSLFPAHPALDERARLVVAVTDAPKPPARRMTMTLPIIGSARSIVVCAFGSEKASAVAEALGGGDSPLARATRDHPDVAWLLDAAAAGYVRRP